MFKSKSFFTKILVFFLIVLLSVTGFVYAETADGEDIDTSVDTTSTSVENVDDNSEIATTHVDKNDVFINSDTVTIDNPISGNAFIIGKDVTVNSVIDGNVFIVANNVTFAENSYIYTDAFICADTVEVAGYIYDLYSVSNSINITSNGYIIRDIHSVCKDFTLDGYVKRNAQINASSINISDSEPVIGGDLNYYSKDQLDINEDSVLGSINYTKSAISSTNILSSTVVLNLIKTLIYSLIIILIIVLAMKKFANNSAKVIKTKFGKSIGFGIFGLICIPIISFLLLFTLVGIPAAIALIFVYVFAITITTPIVAVSLSKTICNKIDRNTTGMVILVSMIIVLAIWLLNLVPVVGWIITFIKTILGIGIILYCIFNSKKLNDEKEITSEVTK